ncbi:MAG TPA: hypothetical protein VFB58_07265 [Chloroflexota bacterium]|nr:hypothetical protein [Chloroflexota bacterium]
MRELRAWITLTRHALLLWRTGQLRFRLETFGVYYPALPYSAPWWRISTPVAFMLLRRARSYAHWLVEMDDLRKKS